MHEREAHLKGHITAARKRTYECRCDERLKTKAEGSTRLTYTGLRGELEHLKIKTRLIDAVGEVDECCLL